MQKSDKILCKKGAMYFRKDSFYNIHEVILDKDNEPFVVILRENTFNEVWFYFNDGSNYLFWDHFYTNQEVRKLKLDKIHQHSP